MADDPTDDDLQTIIRIWITGRSLARGQPAPVFAQGGYRVDVGSAEEVWRWVFPAITDDLRRVVQSVHAPQRFIKVLGEEAQLRAVVPAFWSVTRTGTLMLADQPWTVPDLPSGYVMHSYSHAGVTHVSIFATDETLTASGLAASGYAAEIPDGFVFDRIITQPNHQRRGFGSIVMHALLCAKTNADLPNVLVATDEGQALYHRLGWRSLSPYLTAAIPG